MPINTNEIELSIAGYEKFQRENPQTWGHILHNWAVLKKALDSGSTQADLAALQTALAAAQAILDDLQDQIDNLIIPPPFDPTPLINAIADLQAQIDAIVIPVVPPPFAMPDGLDKQVLTHGPGGNSDFFWAEKCPPVIEVPDGYQITNEECGTTFVGGP